MKIGTKIKAEPRKAELRLRSAIRLAALAAAAVFLVLYSLDVRDGSTAHDCQREDELLAERTYLDPDAPRLLWFHDHVLRIG